MRPGIGLTCLPIRPTLAPEPFCLLVVSSATVLVVAKGATTKITITGAGLQSPIEISDPDVLKNFSVWSGPGTFANHVGLDRDA